MLLGTLDASLLEDMLFSKEGKGTIRAEKEQLERAMDLRDLQSKGLH